MTRRQAAYLLSEQRDETACGRRGQTEGTYIIWFRVWPPDSHDAVGTQVLESRQDEKVVGVVGMSASEEMGYDQKP
jgi:hypothetical protein